MSEDEKQIKFSEETIKSFIKICQNQICQIDHSSIISIQYLSNKFECQELTNIINNIFEDGFQEYAIESILFKINNSENINEIENTTKEEEIISNNIEKYITEYKEQMISLPIHILERIIKRANKTKIKNNQQIMTNFLFEILDKYGKEGSILFNEIDFGEENIGVINRLYQEYSDKFDFNMINSTLSKTTKEVINEMNKQKIEYEQLFKQMKTEIEQQKAEIENIKEKEIQKSKEFEQQYKLQLKNMHEEFEKIKIENEKQIKKIKDSFEQMIEEHKKTTKLGIVSQDHQIVLETMTIDKLKKLKEDTRNKFINEIIEQQKYNKNQKKENDSQLIRRIIFLHQIYDKLSISENIKELNFILENLKKFEIKYNMINNLYQKHYLKEFLIELNQVYDEDFSIELNYQSETFKPIISVIESVKEQFPNIATKIHIVIKIFNNENESNEKSDSPVFTFILKYQPIDDESISTISESYLRKIKQGGNAIQKDEFLNCQIIRQINIPSYITTIGESVFFCALSLTSITIPSSVSSISNYAFHNCESLKQVLFKTPSSLSLIGFNAFSNCSSLKLITIPSSVTNIDKNAFENCSSLTQLEIPSSIKSIEEEILKNCRSLKQVTIPSSVTKINKNAFSECSSLTQISIPSSITVINNCFLNKCSSLTQISIPSSVTSIEDNFCSQCSSLMQISIPSSVRSISNNFCSECSSLMQILIPSSVTKIGDNFCYRCSSLIDISIPSSVSNIGNYFCNECSSLTQVSLPSSLNYIGQKAFQSCPLLTYVSLSQYFHNIQNIVNQSKIVIKRK